MTNYLKEYIKDNIDLIEDNQWGPLYAGIRAGDEPDLSKILLQAGIDPLPYFGYKIPIRYLYGLEVNSIKIPNNIVNIGEMAFKYSKIKELIIPTSIRSIGEGAFTGIKCPDIRYLGTVQDFTNINKSVFWCEDEIEIKCTDGIYQNEYLPK